MKRYMLVLGLILEADPLKNECTTLIRSVDNVVESDNIHELEQMGAEWLYMGGSAYKVLDTTHEHEGVAWSNKAVNQFKEIVRIQSVTNYSNN